MAKAKKPQNKNKRSMKGVKQGTFKKKNRFQKFKPVDTENGVKLSKTKKRKEERKFGRQNHPQKEKNTDPLEIRVNIPKGLWSKSREAVDRITSKCKDICSLSAVIMKFDNAKLIPGTIKSLRNLKMEGTSFDIPSTGLNLKTMASEESLEKRRLQRTFAVKVDFKDIEAVKEYFGAQSVMVIKRTTLKKNLKVCSLTFESEEAAIEATKKTMNIAGMKITLREPFPVQANIQSTEGIENEESNETKGKTKKSREKGSKVVDIEEAEIDDDDNQDDEMQE